MGARKFKLTMINPSAESAIQYLCSFSSGADLKSKGRFVVKKQPAGIDVFEWVDAIIRGRLSDKFRPHASEFEQQREAYLDTSGPAICFQTSGDAAFMEFTFLGYTA